MKRKNIFSLTTGILYLLSSASTVFAGSLTPANYEGRMMIGETISVDKTVTVDPADVPEILDTTVTTVDNKYDILFLADNTGSMGEAIGNVQTNARSLLEQLSNSYNDIQFGVARYYGDPKEYLTRVDSPGTTENTVTKEYSYRGKYWGNHYYYLTTSGMGINNRVTITADKYYGDRVVQYYQLASNATTQAYQLQEQVNTGSINDAIAAINNWEADGGGDLPEANLFALHQAATSGGSTSSGLSTTYNTNWRSDAKKIIVWFGDASSHEFTVDKAEAIQALNDNGITVVAINASNTTDSLTSGINTNSQASDIAEETSGEYAAVYSSNLTDSMLNLIGEAVTNITTETVTAGTVDLGFTSTGDTSGITVVYTCTDSRGCDDVAANETRTFKMDVTGDTSGEYNFNTVVTGVSGATGTNEIEVYGYAD